MSSTVQLLLVTWFDLLKDFSRYPVAARNVPRAIDKATNAR